MNKKSYPQKNTLSKIATFFKTPSRAMISGWVIWLILYIVFPFYHTRSVSFLAFMIIASATFAFVLGDLFCLGGVVNFSKAPVNVSSNVFKSKWSPKLNQLIIKLAIIGIIGSCAVIVVKLFFSGLDFSSGVSGARYSKVSLETNTPLFLYPAMLAYPFGIPAFLCGSLQGFELSKLALNLSRVSALFSLSTTIINGGRAGIFLFIFIALGASLLNSLQSKHDVEKTRQRGNFKFILLITFFFVLYSGYIAASRRDVTDMTGIPFTSALYEMKASNGFYPADWVIDLVETGLLNSDLVLNIMQFDYYLTHAPVAFTAYLESNVSSMGPYYGQYQIGLFGIILNKTFPDLSLFKPLFTELGMAGVEGVFLSGWGTIWVDLGVAGLFFQAFFMGFISRLVYHNAINKSRNMPVKLIFCFVFASIVLTPLMAPFLMSESSFIFFAILLTAMSIKRIEETEIVMKSL